MLRGIAAFRWGALAWMGAVITVERNDMRRAWLAWALLLVAFAVTAAATVLATRAPDVLLRPEWLATELAVGVIVSVAGGWVYPATHDASVAFASTRNLGSAWPLSGVLSAGVAMGPLVGGVSGLVIALARLASPIVAGVPAGDFGRSQWLSLMSTTLLYVLGGAVA